MPEGIIVCPNCRMRVLAKSDGTCPSCHFMLEWAGSQIELKTPEPTQKPEVRAIANVDKSQQKPITTTGPRRRNFVWFSILLAIILLSLFGSGFLKSVNLPFDLIALLGTVLGLSGTIAVIYSVKSSVVGKDQKKSFAVSFSLLLA